MSARILSITLAVVGLGVGAFAAQSRYPGVVVPAPADSWEYQVIVEPTPSGGSSLNRLGQSGWELVSVLTQTEHTGNTSRTNTHFFFKRRIPTHPQ